MGHAILEKFQLLPQFRREPLEYSLCLRIQRKGGANLNGMLQGTKLINL